MNSVNALFSTNNNERTRTNIGILTVCTNITAPETGLTSSNSEIGIVSAILSFLGHNDLDSLSQTCFTGLYAVKSFRQSAMKIEKILLRFFRNLEELGEFQSMQQGKTGTIVSGSVALQFFRRKVYDESDLDTYCMLLKCLDMGRWYEHIGYEYKPVKKQRSRYEDDYERVLNNEGMSQINVEGNDGDDIRGAERYRSIDIAEVWNFERSDGRRIQLVATRILPEAIVLGFHSTCVMNLITHKAAYSLFPRTTFKRKTTILVNARGQLLQKYEQAVQKYRHRGFRVKSHAPLNSAIEDEFGFVVPRWIGDRSTWVHRIEYFGHGELPKDNTGRVGWDIVSIGRRNYMEYEQLFTGDDERVAYEEGKQLLMARTEIEMVREKIGQRDRWATM
ncbi:hypothetical protein F5880DRAFT_1493540 [Lentinula raphanica]|nr:hypothetical protein F5880DRAFT_1493540 [Lentinula raphanica]